MFLYVLCFYPETILILVLVCWTRWRRRGRFTSRRWWRIVGNRVPTHPQLRLVNGGQLALLAHAWLAPWSERSFHWLLAAGEPRVRVDHLLHLRKDNKWRWKSSLKRMLLTWWQLLYLNVSSLQHVLSLKEIVETVHYSTLDFLWFVKQQPTVFALVD